MRTLLLTLVATLAAAQSTFSVTGTQIPPELLKVNYGRVPKSILGFDISVCNQSAEKHAVTASQIYQALAASNVRLQPLGGQIMSAVILQNRRRSTTTVLNVAVNSAVGVLSVLGAARTGISPATLAVAALGAAVGQQLLLNLNPVLTPDQLARFQNQVLESALALDGGSCAERTVFTLLTPGATGSFQNLTFHVR